MPLSEDYSSPRTFLTKLPRKLYLIAAGAALLHIAPYWRANLQTPEQWTFTWNLSHPNSSPDFLQYRSWYRESQRSGPIIPDKLTSEPNRPYVPVFFYYAIGKVAAWTDSQPEKVYAYAGAFLAFGFTILLFGAVRLFTSSNVTTWWTFWILLLSGGLGTWLKLISQFNFIKHLSFLQWLIYEPITFGLFEEFRGDYIFTTLFDTHFLLVWTLTTAAIVAIYFLLQGFTPARMITVSFLSAAIVCLHFYEGVLLLCIMAMTAFLCSRGGLVQRRSVMALLVPATCIVAAYAWIILLQHRSGLPRPTWRAPTTPASALFMGYPLAWVALATGIFGYWTTAKLKETFLLGWAAACTILTLAGPFYPYSPRGTMTLQIPLYLIAIVIFMEKRWRLRRPIAAFAIVFMGALPFWYLGKKWQDTKFSASLNYMFLSPSHSRMIDALNVRAAKDDVLLTDANAKLWLGPTYPGVEYCAHPVFTVNYSEKTEQVQRFYVASPAEQQQFLTRNHIRFVYSDKSTDLRNLEQVPSLQTILQEPIGTLFEYNGEQAEAESQ